MEPKAKGAHCDLCPLSLRPFVHPPIRRALLALVAERPDQYELEKGRYFAGPSGELLFERILPQAGVKQNEVSLHNAVLCTIDHKLSPTEWKTAIACCSARLHHDLKMARPKVVIAAGKVGLQALTGRAQITKWTGAPIKGGRFVFKEGKEGKVELKIAKPKDKEVIDFSSFTVLPIMHPAWHFRGSNISYLPMSRIHFERAKLIAENKLEEWTWPQIEINANEAALTLLKKLQREGRNGKRISYDVESLGDNPFSSALSCIGVGHRDIGAVSLPWETYHAGKWGLVRGVSRSDVFGVERQCRDTLLEILRDPKIAKVSQNGQYDRMCLRTRKIEVRGEDYDTMRAHAVYAPALKHSLSLICSIEFHAPRWKEEFKVGSGKDVA